MVFVGEEEGKCNPCWLSLGIPVVESQNDFEKKDKHCDEHQWGQKGSETCREKPSLWFWDCQKYQCLKCSKKVLIQEDLGDAGFVCGKDN